MSDAIYYAYVLCDPRKPGRFKFDNMVLKYEPFYVGKGKGNRAEQHLAEARLTSTRTYKLHVLRQILGAGLEPVIYRTPLINEARAFEREQELIAVMGRRKTGGFLTNLTDGGDGVSGLVHTKESLEIMSRSQRARFDSMSKKQRREFAKHLRAAKDKAAQASAKSRRNYTEEKRQQVSESLSSAWARLTPEQIRLREVRRLRSLKSKPTEERSAIADRKRSTRAAKGPEWEAEVQARRLASRAAASDEERARTHELVSAALRARHLKNQEATLSDAKLKQVRRMINSGNHTQQEIAKKFGITQDRVSKISRGIERPWVQP